MQRPERLIGGSHAAFRTVRIGEIDRHEHGPAAVSVSDAAAASPFA